jgi:hypothetical protein
MRLQTRGELVNAQVRVLTAALLIATAYMEGLPSMFEKLPALSTQGTRHRSLVLQGLPVHCCDKIIIGPR